MPAPCTDQSAPRAISNPAKICCKRLTMSQYSEYPPQAPEEKWLRENFCTICRVALAIVLLGAAIFGSPHSVEPGPRSARLRRATLPPKTLPHRGATNLNESHTR